MRLGIAAIGRLRRGPEQALIDDYVARAERAGRALGLGPIQITELADKKGGGKAAEAQLLSRAVPDGAVLIALDERGQTLSSPKFAEKLADWRDQGRAGVWFVIGGADGLDPVLVAQADLTLSFGKMVWPHMLARVMLSEQIYRAVSILSGSPYHRE